MLRPFAPNNRCTIFNGSLCSRFYSSSSSLKDDDNNVAERWPTPAGRGRDRMASPEEEISRPWANLLDMLVRKGYLSSSGHGHGGAIGTKDSNRVRTACLNFGRQRVDLISYLNRKDVHLVVESGCPSLDRKVVHSGKRLRSYVGIEEGTVCSSCSLRGDCEMAFVRAPADEVGQTVDVMRFILTYGLDHVTSSIVNKSCLAKRVKESVSNLISQLVKLIVHEPCSEHFEVNKQRFLSKNGYREIEVPKKLGDWNCPKCNFLNFAKNIKCLHCDELVEERLRSLGENQEYLPLKKGDWLCEKCNFLNFAKNAKCLQCKERPSNRSLNPGEWECPSCNYVNFRKNMLCLKCDWKRPKALNVVEAYEECRLEDQNLHYFKRTKFVREVMDGEHTLNKDADSFFENYTKGVGNHELLDDVDFPIVGGKNSVTKDCQLREKWKIKKSKKFQDKIRYIEDDNHRRIFTNINCGLRPYGSNDDKEMASWFGYGKKE